MKGDLRIGAQPKLRGEKTMTSKPLELATQLIERMEAKHPETQVKDNLGLAVAQEPFF